MQEEGTTVIVSVSPQSRASLAEATGLDVDAVQRRLTSFFTKLVSSRSLLWLWEWAAHCYSYVWAAQRGLLNVDVVHGVSVPCLVLQGVALVFDTVAGRNFSLVETAAEFLHRYRTAHPEAATPDALSGMSHHANGENVSFLRSTSERMAAIQLTMLVLTLTHGQVWCACQAQHL